MNLQGTCRVAIAAALASLLGAAGGAEPGHRMVTAKDLTWADVPSLPPGVKAAVI